MNKSFYTIISWVFGERKDLWWILTVSCDLAEQIHVSRLRSPVWCNMVCPRVILDADGWANILSTLGGSSPFSLVLQLLKRGSIELCVVLWIVTSRLGTYTVCAPYPQISLCAPMGRYAVQP